MELVFSLLDSRSSEELNTKFSPFEVSLLIVQNLLISWRLEQVFFKECKHEIEYSFILLSQLHINSEEEVLQQ